MTTPIIHGTVLPVRNGAADAQLVVLGPSLGTTTALWADVAHRLAETYRVLCFDLPGHGSSPAARAPFTVAEVAAGVVALVDSIGGGAFHYSGISFGGTVGLELAIRYPSRLASLAVICSGAKIGAAEGWIDRAAQVRASGTAAMVAGSSERWFAPGFLERNPAAGGSALKRLVDVDDESYALCCEALAAFDETDAVAAIRTPTLCVSGEFDLPTPTAVLAELATVIPGARLVTMSGVAHLPAYERPDALATLLGEHLASAAAAASGNADSVFENGMAVRRSVLGDTHVDAATSAITPETADFQDFITRYAWGEVWTRPVLDRRSRSLLTLASLITGGHQHEFAMHVRAALTNGLTRAEISEAILHTALYAGLPAANTAFGIARDTYAALDVAADQAAAAASATSLDPSAQRQAEESR
ncbi:alpha/beta fold hydrolase [Leifsonia sp. A12D58]|uniref:bifunctional 3-oxoadipate enol-lactonase/4-carboxymuconolactone decarboxylase PcaDC n=1 Tax=Leifsonia sp. A12D58 TaxID=3397674 RepID=UPI0039E035C6